MAPCITRIIPAVRSTMPAIMKIVPTIIFFIRLIYDLTVHLNIRPQHNEYTYNSPPCLYC